MRNYKVDIATVLAGEPLEKAVRWTPTKIETAAAQLMVGDKVRYQRQDRDGSPLTVVHGFIEKMTMTSCIIFDTRRDEFVAASLDRVEFKGRMVSS